VVLRALHRLIWAKQVAVKYSNAFIRGLDERMIGANALVSNSGDFNELLALGYMEDDKINVSPCPCYPSSLLTCGNTVSR
jgi:hypothetical protein